MQNFLSDVRFTIRQLWKNPGFSAVVLLILALGIGVNTGIFSIVNAVLYKQLPYTSADRLAIVFEQNLKRGWTENIVSAPNFVDWKQQNNVFDDMAAFDSRLFVMTGGGKAEEIPGEQVTTNLFSLLGVQPLLGRFFLPQEGEQESATAVLSYGLWKEHYGGDPSLVGKQISLDGDSYTVVGILPGNFSDDYATATLAPSSRVWVSGLALATGGRVEHEFNVIARLKPGITLARAQAEMDTISNRIQLQFPEDKGWSAAVVGLHAQIVEHTRPALLVLLGAVALVLLIACANVANLSLVRVAGREKEIAIRTAMGAGRGLIVRQFLIESILLSITGGTLGLLMAVWSARILGRFLPTGTQPISGIGLNATVLLFALIVAVGTGIIFGLAPAVAGSKANVNESLKESVRGSTKGSKAQRLRDALVVSEFALALALLIAAGLMIKSLGNLDRVNLGFSPDRLLTMATPLKGPQYKNYSQQIQFFQQLVSRIEALPGVEGATVSRGVPIDGWAGWGFVTADDPNPPAENAPDANYVVIAPHYFRTMGIAVREGRAFTDSDTTSSQLVVVINEALARKYWPGQDPIGKRLRMVTNDRNAPWLLVVGVAKNVRTQGQYADFQPEIYVPYTQNPLMWPQNIIVRTTANPATIVPAIRREVAALNKDVPVSQVSTMKEIVAGPMLQEETITWLLGAFAALAIILAAVGIYSVIAYTVTQRTREIGIRMALGANRANIASLFVKQGLVVALFGVFVGLTLAFGVSRFLSSLLFGVQSTDLLIFTAVPAILAVVALLASYIPARRAAKVDPMVALRYE